MPRPLLPALGPDFQPLLTDFLRAADLVRVLLLVSPTWEMCLQGASRAGAGLLAALQDDGLVCFYTWVPMLPADNERAARAAARRFADERARHYWDADRRLAGALGAALSLPAAAPSGGPPARALAWDVYLAYSRGVTDIERPDFWMHQLNVEHAPPLDEGVWRQRVRELLRA